MNMGGGQRMTIQKSTFNGERGYNEVQGQRIVLLIRNIKSKIS